MRSTVWFSNDGGEDIEKRRKWYGAAFNRNPLKATCLLCNSEDETLDHFLLGCGKLQDVRSPIMSDLLREYEAICKKLEIRTLDSSLLEIIVDCTCNLDTNPNLKAYIFGPVPYS